MITVWLFWGSLSLGCPSAVLNVFVPLKCTCMPFFLYSFLNFSPVFGMYGTTMVMFFLLLAGRLLLLLLLMLVVVGWLGLVHLCCHWLSPSLETDNAVMLS